MPEKLEAWPAGSATSMTEPCASFFKDIYALYGFLALMSKGARQIDQDTRVATAELVTVADLVEGLVEEPSGTDSEKGPKDTEGTKEKLWRYRTFMWEIWLSRGVDSYLNYLSGLLGLIFRTSPETIQSADTVRFDAILEHTTMGDLIESQAERRVHELSYQGMATLARYWHSRLKFELFSDAERLAMGIRIVETRNLILHNRGVVNEVFIARVANSGARLGQRIDVSKAGKDLQFLQLAVADTDARAAAKFELPRPIAKPAAAEADPVLAPNV